MLKKRTLIITASIIVVVAGLFLTKHNKRLGVLGKNINTITTSGTAFTFTTGEFKKIKLKYDASVYKGSIYFEILDSKENVVFTSEECDSELNEEKIVELDKVDEYIVEAKYTDYKGSFKLVAYKVEE